MRNVWTCSCWTIIVSLFVAVGCCSARAENIFAKEATELARKVIGGSRSTLAIVPYPERCQVKVFQSSVSRGDPKLYHFHFENLKSKNVKVQRDSSVLKIIVPEIPIFESVGSEAACKEIARHSNLKCRSAYGEYGFWKNEMVLIPQNLEQQTRLLNSLAQIEEFCREMLFDGEEN